MREMIKLLSVEWRNTPRLLITEIGSIKTDPQLLRMTMDAVPMSADAFKSKEGIMAYVSILPSVWESWNQVYWE